MQRNMFNLLSGMDALLDLHRAPIPKTSGFPPYNVRKTGENTYQVELAVAGFTLADLEVVLEKNYLTIKSKGHDTSKDGEYIHQGFAFRAFERVFTLVDNVRVSNAELLNGVLRVYLEKLIPEEEKPKRINISAPDAEKHPQLLNESSSF